MKQMSFKIIFILTLAFFPTITHAQYAVFDAQNFARQLANYAQLGLTYAKEVSTDFSSAITAAQQTSATIDQTITRPLRDAMTLVTVANSADQILNLINGSTNGKSLLITNPQQYLENVGRQSVAANLSRVENAGGLYSESILNTVIDSVREESDIASKITSLSRSTIPTSIQNDVCKEQTLSALAEDSAVDTTGAIDEEMYGSTKEFYYTTFCEGDPSEDPALANRLLELNKQRPDVGDGWDILLKKTTTDNNFYKTFRAADEIEKEKQTKIALKQKDLDYGQGIASENLCTEYSEPDSAGEVYCLEESITNPASALRDAYSKAKTSAFDTAMQAFGSGQGGGFFDDLSDLFGFSSEAFGGIASTIGSVVTTVGTVNTVANNLGNTATSIANRLDGTTSTTGNTARVASRSYTKDLTNEDKTKTTLFASVRKQLNAHLESINQLKSTNASFLAKISAYQTNLESMKGCYDALVRDYGTPIVVQTEDGSTTIPSRMSSSDGRITSAFSYYNSKTSTNNALTSKLNTELSSTIPATEAIINNALSSITSSNSSEEIFDIFNNYQNQIDSRALPVINSGTARQSEYLTYDGELQAELSVIGTLYSLQNQCSVIRQQLQDEDRNGGE